ncbi:spindle and kinetochore-associated protein 1 homolog isoform X3 [Triticum urartu]|uniref:spindle and kinetochore-associated protein 1 homolog isoform X3 n=1 Tax=Triticum urartu TaxID=4572 RepID=UPI0020442F71|nr:spindle and kinetochore-associated protein 1 homolog isoform X3 [Triticum urartu]
MEAAAAAAAIPGSSSLEAVATAFRSRVNELQDLALARNMYPATAVTDLTAVDTSVTAMEAQVQAIRRRLQEELDAIPKAKKLVEKSLKQQQKLQHMLANMPPGMREDIVATPLEQSLYMRGRLTLEKVNISINEVATYADANAHLVACPKKKLSEDTWEKALELRDIAATEAVKGKHFFLEADIKGPGLKLDHTGKAILTVLRHLGRVHETRIGHHRVFILSKQC